MVLVQGARYLALQEQAVDAFFKASDEEHPPVESERVKGRRCPCTASGARTASLVIDQVLRH
jgi:hypothetical protein